MTGTIPALLLGLVLGARHALEPDHLTAVSTLASDEPGARRGLYIGAVWGLGHSASLFAVGTVLALLHAEMPRRLATAFEVVVGVMLIVLGLRALARVRSGQAMHTHARRRGRALAWRSLVVGMVHGLAGSGALTALVLAELPTTASRLGYIVLFGAGSVAGMSLLSGAVGVPLALVGRRDSARAALSAVSGCVSVALGIFWALRF
jgi:ABC-type nickel/cobalt efflux system permease component RcnA